VVLWLVSSSSNQGDQDAANETIANFRTKFPDVRVIMIGNNVAPYQDLLEFNDDFITVNEGDLLPPVEHTILQRAHDTPRSFIYPYCYQQNNDTDDNSNYQESSHTYIGAVTPNRTAFIEIPATYFHLSEQVSVTVEAENNGDDIVVCMSRSNRYALMSPYTMYSNDPNLMYQQDDDNLECNTTVTYEHPCDKDLAECNPIYISIQTGNTSMSRGCSSGDDGCLVPGMVTYKLSHDGLTCGSSVALPAAVLLAVVALLNQLL